MKTYVVIGLGRFGQAVAKKLYQLGNEVMAIDASDENVQQMANCVTHAVVGDARDEGVLKALGVRNYDCAVVAIGGDLAASILITLTLKEYGVPTVVCKASTELNKKALERVGADRVVIPEREMATKLAQSLAKANILDFIELSQDYGILEFAVPKSWVGKDLRQLNVRAKFGVTVLAFKENGTMNVQPHADEPLKSGTTIVVLGATDKLNKLPGQS